MILFLITMEIIGVGCFVWASVEAPRITGVDWIRFAILAIGGTAHIQFTHRQEERRRNRTRTVLIDLTAVWLFPAAIVLPVPLILLLVVVIRTQRWFTARRPAHNFIFSSVTHGLAATTAHLTFVALSLSSWITVPGVGSIVTFGLFIVAGLVYEGIQLAYVGGILALGASSTPTLRNVLGSKADNLLETMTIGLGAVTAILLVTMPPAVAIMAVVTVVFNRLAELDQLQDEARNDSKTGVFNMRGWSEAAERALERSLRADESLALMMIDLDHFKWINDTFGHPAGDDVLRNVAQTLGEVTRPADVVGRFGGEEFLVLLPDVTETTTKVAAERLRNAIEDLRIATTDKRGGQTTISGRTASVGVAMSPANGSTLESLLLAADSAVYDAKESGRNQVRFASVLPVPPTGTASQ